MYPAHFLSLFPPFPREDAIFVAMSFAPQFQARWQNVIQPAVGKLAHDGVPFKALRVDAGKIADSILTEILQGVSSSRLVFADITTIGKLNDHPVRNGNVMYEVGIAQAVRLPQEVILFRSDNDPLLFDVSNIRINHYSPDEDPDEARRFLAKTFFDALSEIDLQRHLAVRKAIDALDATCWPVCVDAAYHGTIRHPVVKTMRDFHAHFFRRTAISRLLELGILRAKYEPIKIIPEMDIDAAIEGNHPCYELTEFGRQVTSQVISQLGSPEFEKTLEQIAAKKEQTVRELLKDPVVPTNGSELT